MQRTLTFVSCLTLLFSASLAYSNVALEMVPVRNPGNVPDDTGYGAVDYEYRISKHEVTNDQYVEFLNSVAASDPFELYNPFMGSSERGGIVRTGLPGAYTYSVKTAAPAKGPGGTSDYDYTDKPVIAVSWYDAVRFTNWLHNGRGTGDTETGAYTLTGGIPIPTNGLQVSRNVGARWFLPTENEWYKAAYYDPSNMTYYDYPTSSDDKPANLFFSSDREHIANYFDGRYTTGDSEYPLVDVDEFPLSLSPYGTLHQGGNIDEWLEPLRDPTARLHLGGDWHTDERNLKAGGRNSSRPHGEGITVGFRIASVIPEPSTLLLIMAAACGVLLDRNCPFG